MGVLGMTIAREYGGLGMGITSYNRILSGPQFWDGRAEDLMEQAKGPVQAGVEMNNAPDRVVATLADSVFQSEVIMGEGAFTRQGCDDSIEVRLLARREDDARTRFHARSRDCLADSAARSGDKGDAFAHDLPP